MALILKETVSLKRYWAGEQKENHGCNINSGCR